VQSEVIGTIEVLLLIVGLTELIKALGLEGRQVIVLAGSIGALLGGLSYAATEGVLAGEPAMWVRIVVGAVWVGMKGLAASGLVKFAVKRVQQAVAFGLRYRDLLQHAAPPGPLPKGPPFRQGHVNPVTGALEWDP